jgi:hypothetical protein
MVAPGKDTRRILFLDFSFIPQRLVVTGLVLSRSLTKVHDRKTALPQLLPALNPANLAVRAAKTRFCTATGSADPSPEYLRKIVN